ncbi:TPA: hypothetical protein N0F65_004228 [Lagenidium giganteum]|uniref:PNPLA domain-containing protein n=1 Tax=Lagenidium giganteum TaxID=4803 RepID=A0AAV2ZDQ0_9STRA|nr:TPA: hypothetical protein N0F65_004228 [Lagenidium giganteum]
MPGNHSATTDDLRQHELAAQKDVQLDVQPHAHSDDELDMEGYSITVKQDDTDAAKCGAASCSQLQPVEIAFAASAGVFVYQMGVAAYLQDHFDLSNCHFSACSGGTWAATLLAAGTDVRAGWVAIENAQRKIISGNSWYSGYGRYAKIVIEALQYLYKDDPDVHERVQKRGLSIAVTKFPSMQPEKHTSWESREDLTKSILASALVPFALTGKPCITHRGQWYIDGAFTNFKGIKCDSNSTWADLYFHTAQTLLDTVKMSTAAISDYLVPSWTKPLTNLIHNALPVLESPHEAVAPQKSSDSKRLIVIRPWEWRSHSVTAFHLSVDLATHKERFDMGYQDALNHHQELAAILPLKSDGAVGA